MTNETALWPRFSDWLAWALVLLYIGTFAWLAWLRHASFNSSGFDLGIYDQVVWNTFQGRWFFYTTTGEPALHFSNHASLNILLIAPFYFIHSGPETLLVLQAAAIGLGGLPIFWLAREKLESDIAGLTLLALYLLFPTLQIVTLWDFHPPALSVAFFVFAFYFLVKERYILFVVMVVIAMAGKEQLPLQAAFLGLYAGLMQRAWRVAAVTVGISIVWFAMVMYWLIPANSTTGEHIFIGYYADLGDSPTEIVVTALTRPDIVLRNVWQPAKIQYMLDVLTPFAGLPLLGLPVLLIGTPSFAINLLSANTAMHDATGGQYGADVAPWLALAAVYGAANLRGWALRWWPKHGQRITWSLCGVVFAVAMGWQLFRGYSPLALDPPHWAITAHDRLAQRFIAQIPPEASLSAQGKLYPHVSNREIAYQLPDVNQAEYVFFDVTTGTWPVHPNDIWAIGQDLLASGDYGILDAADGYLLLKRGLDDTSMPSEFYDFARVTTPEPEYPLVVEFGESLRLLGFDVLDDPRRRETAIRLYWQPLESLARDVRLYPFMIDAEGNLVEDTNQRPLLAQLWYPPRLWTPGEFVVAETMPWTLGERWSLAVGVLSGSEWADWSQRMPVHIVEADRPLRRFEANTWVRLATFERQGRHLVEIIPTDADMQPQYSVTANLGDKMNLYGYSAQPAAAGQELPVTLFWEASAPMATDYSVFVHLVDDAGQRVAQHDGQPWWEAPIPTSTWQPGERLQDWHTLELPADLAPGVYELQAGVYHWQTLERLEVLENGVPVQNYVVLGDVVVE